MPATVVYGSATLKTAIILLYSCPVSMFACFMKKVDAGLTVWSRFSTFNVPVFACLESGLGWELRQTVK